MTPNQALLVGLLLVVGSWFFWPMIFNYGIGIELPFFGFLGIKPFEFLNEYFTLIVGGSVAIVMFFMLRKRDRGR